MLRFAHEEYLYGLWVLPVIFIFFILYRRWRSKKMDQLGEKHLIKRLFPDISNFKPWLKISLFTLAVFSLIIGMADPQIGTRLEEVKREGVDIMVALDVSNSMGAEDIRPNRLERSKQAIYRMIDQLRNDRLGLIIFAGKAYLQLPLTTDFAAAKLFLSTVNSDLIPTQGTAIGASIQLAMQSMDNKDNKHKVLIIITDGENHEDDALGEAKKASEQGVIIHTIGMGSEAGGPIPVNKNNSISYLKDQDGNVVVTKLDEAILEQISTAGKGRFIRASNNDDGLGLLLADINKMEKKNFGTKIFTDYEDRFQYFLGAALLFLLFELLLSERSSRWWKSLNLFGNATNEAK